MNYLGCVACLKRTMLTLALVGAAACDNAQRRDDVVADAGGVPVGQTLGTITALRPKWLPKQTYTYRLKLESRLAIGDQPPMVAFHLASERGRAPTSRIARKIPSVLGSLSWAKVQRSQRGCRWAI